MHTSIEQLISLRDGQPVAATAAAHVRSCNACLGRLEALRNCRQALRELPLHEPSPQLLEAVRTRINQQVSGRQRIAVAATVAVAAVLIVTWASVSVHLNERPQTAAVDHRVTGPALAAQTAATRELIRRSQALESVYAQLSQVPIAEYSASTASALEVLQNRLAMLDYGLNQSQLDSGVQRQIEQLWSRRVDTLQNMVGVKYAELARQGYYSFQVLPASYLDDDAIRW